MIMNYKLVVFILNCIIFSGFNCQVMHAKEQCGSSHHMKKWIEHAKSSGEKRKLFERKLKKVASVLYHGLAASVVQHHAREKLPQLWHTL